MGQKRTIFFAGGGTGGHIYPAVAVAQRIMAVDGFDVQILCSTRPIDRQVLEPLGIAFTALPATALGLGLAKAARFMATFWASYRRACRLLAGRDVAATVGVGGFVAAPACLAARRLGIPVYLINVDILPGKANRLVARWAREVFVQFDRTREAFSDLACRVTVTGCPLRVQFDRPDPAMARQQLGLDPRLHALLVTGASSGAMNINEAVVRILPRLEAFKDTWQVVHITGARHIEQVQAGYSGAAIRHNVIAYYHQMADLYAACDLVVGRSGAVSVAEYVACGLPSICMPYPYHRDRHQYLNAKVLADAGAAVIVEDVPDPEQRADRLWRQLAILLADSNARQRMAAACRHLARPGAATAIAEAIMAGADNMDLA